jgi:hypothetical protein
MTLHLHPGRDAWNRPYTEVRTDDRCPNCDGPATIAHTAFEVVAMTLGEVLRRAFREHRDAHSCATTHCPEANELFWMQPAGDTVLIG